MSIIQRMRHRCTSTQSIYIEEIHPIGGYIGSLPPPKLICAVWLKRGCPCSMKECKPTPKKQYLKSSSGTMNGRGLLATSTTLQQLFLSVCVHIAKDDRVKELTAEMLKVIEHAGLCHQLGCSSDPTSSRSNNVINDSIDFMQSCLFFLFSSSHLMMYAACVHISFLFSS